eukprot:52448-Chlamydomonas_euryale.AAC.3
MPLQRPDFEDFAVAAIALIMVFMMVSTSTSDARATSSRTPTGWGLASTYMWAGLEACDLQPSLHLHSLRHPACDLHPLLTSWRPLRRPQLRWASCS